MTYMTLTNAEGALFLSKHFTMASQNRTISHN